MTGLRRTFICLLGLMAFTILSCKVVRASSDYDNGQPINTLNKYQAITTNTKLNSKYTFIPKVQANTAVKVFGTTESNDDRFDHTKNQVINLTNAQKGKVGFLYTNVGQDGTGHSLDLKIIIDNWSNVAKTGDALIGARDHQKSSR